MPSIVDICNRALDQIGSDPITSLEDGTKAAKICQRNYPFERDLVLSAYPWNASMRRASLAALVDAPLYNYTYQYQLPEDCLRLYDVEPGHEWKVEGRQIITDYEPPLKILYSARIEDPNQYSPMLIETIAARLAVCLAENIVDSASKIAQMQQKFEIVFARAKQADAQEGRSRDDKDGIGDSIQNYDWLWSRF